MYGGRAYGMISGFAHLISGLLVASTLPTMGLNAQPVHMIDADQVPQTYASIDIRTEASCLDTTLAHARCLPADWILGAENRPVIGFHALRWLLGTVGLRGQETLVIYTGGEVALDEAKSVAAMVYLAGQHQVYILNGVSPAPQSGGEGRSLSREVVFTAPMRTEHLTVTDAAGHELKVALVEFAQSGGSVAYPAHLNQQE